MAQPVVTLSLCLGSNKAEVRHNLSLEAAPCCSRLGCGTPCCVLCSMGCTSYSFHTPSWRSTRHPGCTWSLDLKVGHLSLLCLKSLLFCKTCKCYNFDIIEVKIQIKYIKSAIYIKACGQWHLCCLSQATYWIVSLPSGTSLLHNT